MGPRPARAVLPAVVLALSVGCSTGIATEGERTEPQVAISFTQLPIQVGSDEGLVRLTNTGRSDLPVQGVGLDWAGYGGRFIRDKDSVVPPGHTIDFPVALPTPDCDDESGEVTGLVDTGEATVRQRMSESGEHLLRRLRRLACQRAYVRDHVQVEYGDAWRYVGAGRDTYLLGHLELTRGEGDDPVELVDVAGSPLYELDLPGVSTLPPDVAEGRVPLRVTTGNRCDQHSRSDVTAPFNFRLTLRVGRQEAVLPIAPPRGVRLRAAELVNRVCG